MYRRFPKWLLVAMGVLAFGLFVPAAQASVPLTQISSDPFTNSTSQHVTEVEPDSFAHGSTIVAAFQQGRFPDINGGSSDIGFSTSTDAGTTWADGSLPLTTFSGGPFDRATDPVVGYDAKTGVWLIASIALDSAGWTVLVDRSTDGGHTWGDPITVAPASPQTGFDKPWITCDGTSTSPFYGNCYLEWVDIAQNLKVEMSTSSDGGLTWGAMKTPANVTVASGGQPVVQPDGTVVVAVTDYPSDTTSQLSDFRSVDGGASWSSEVPISVAKSPALAGGLREGLSPSSSAGVDGAGKIYLAWQDCTFRPNCSSDESANGGANDIVYSTSTDGLKWSRVKRIPIAPVSGGVDAFLPGLGVDGSTSGSHAHLALTYYYYPQANCDYSTCQLDVGFVSSTDGGATWSAPTQLAGPMSLSWLPASENGPMTGDYFSTSFTADGLAHGFFAVAKAPTNAGFDEAIYTTTHGLRPASPCVVPKVVRESLAKAKAAISKHNCRTGTIHRATSPKVRRGLVIAQKPKPQKVLPAGGKVSLVVSRGKRP